MAAAVCCCAGGRPESRALRSRSLRNVIHCYRPSITWNIRRPAARLSKAPGRNPSLMCWIMRSSA